MRLRATLVVLASGFCVLGVPVAASEYISVPGGSFRSALKAENAERRELLAAFSLMKNPVTNGEFLEFVTLHPEWRRDRIPSVFAESRYLSQWSGPLVIGASAAAAQPVVWVSWFAAEAFCEAQDAQLPTWAQWEYVAAADETRRDARADPAWRERILGWYSRPSNTALPRVGLQAPNAYGIQEMHGLVWEWTDDFSSLLVSADNRSQGDADKSRFCGDSGLTMDDQNNYAVLMRVAMLSSLEASDATANMGFRCARKLR